MWRQRVFSTAVMRVPRGSKVAGFELNARFPSFAAVKIGQVADLVFDPRDVHFFDSDTGETLRRLPRQGEENEGKTA